MSYGSNHPKVIIIRLWEWFVPVGIVALSQFRNTVRGGEQNFNFNLALPEIYFFSHLLSAYLELSSIETSNSLVKPQNQDSVCQDGLVSLSSV